MCASSRRLSCWTFLSATLAAMFVAVPAHAQDYWHEEDIERPHARVDVPLVDAPYNFVERRRSYSWFQSPSMQQSLGITAGLTQSVHAGLGLALDPYAGTFWPRFFTRAGFVAFDFLTADLPGFSGWQHAEWHRAVMTNRNVKSYNEINDLRTNAKSGTIGVSGERDESLARMKKDHNRDFVRLQEAGFEAQLELNKRLNEEAFFFGTRTWNVGTLWFNYLNSYLYLHACSEGKTDEIVNDLYDDRETEQQRDFAGPDCTGWVYDLHRPDEPYAARGKHPSGVGIDRYRTWGDLTRDEHRYLARTSRMALLNFIDPFAYSFDDFWWQTQDRANFYWNARVFHYLTSFGGDTGTAFYYKERSFKAYGALHMYHNKSGVFPGLEFKWFDAWTGDGTMGTREASQTRSSVASPLAALSLSPRVMLWTQPRGLSFRTAQPRLGSLVSLRADWREPRWLQPWVEVESKSEGWVAGVVNQGSGVAGRVGVASEF